MDNGKKEFKEIEFKIDAPLMIETGCYSITGRSFEVSSDIIVSENCTLKIDRADLKFAPGVKILCKGVLNASDSVFNGGRETNTCNFISLAGEKTSGSSFTRCEFKSFDCEASKAFGDGGAIILTGTLDAVINFDACSFQGCSAQLSGGAVFCHKSTPVMKDCSFQGCKTIDLEGSGGALFISECEPYIVNCKFSECSAGAGLNYTGGGGAIFCSGASPKIENCDFSGCSSAGHGGAICCNNASAPKISFSAFEKCKTAKNHSVGGAIFCDSFSQASIASSSFSNCSAIVRGGALGFSNNSNSSINSCKFIGCTAASKEFGVGGAAYSYNSSPEFFGCSFVECSTNGRGGALYCDCRSHVSVESCSFEKCSSKDAGGAIFYDITAHAKILAPEFNGCTPNNINREKTASDRIEKSVKMAGGTTNHCFIATAACGSESAPEVTTLKKFRDAVLAKSVAGRAFIKTYYRLSPPLARVIAKNPSLKKHALRMVKALAAMVADKRR